MIRRGILKAGEGSPGIRKRKPEIRLRKFWDQERDGIFKTGGESPGIMRGILKHERRVFIGSDDQRLLVRDMRPWTK